MLKPPEFKRSPETQIIYDIFRDIESREGEPVTYLELCEATGQPKDKIRGAISTARIRVLRDCGIVIHRVVGVGYRQIKGSDVADVAQSVIQHVRRTQSLGLEKLNCVDTRSLSASERATFDVRKSVLELGLLATRPRTISNINQMVIRKSNELDPTEMMQAIRDALIKNR